MKIRSLSRAGTRRDVLSIEVGKEKRTFSTGKHEIRKYMKQAEEGESNAKLRCADFFMYFLISCFPVERAPIPKAVFF